ncbi:hypothetical protein E6H14_00520 [Candidatus Bathyarchaeota archaeon]|nr:MAG: hypothetical protein E6H14_00520 [Candidatus Bathyarchaeota archaeon]
MGMEIVVRVKVADGVEMEVRGEKEWFVEALDQLPGMVSKLRDSLSPASPSIIPLAESREIESLPTIIRPKGTQDAIVKAVSTAWGKATSRTAKEIDTVLKHNAVHISEGSLTGSLTLLVQANKLRRLKVGGTYAYTLPISKMESEQAPEIPA